MGKKDGKPWGFGLLGGKNGTKSVLTFFLILVLAILTHIVAAVRGELEDRRARPVLALKSILRDVREFVRVEKKMPANLAEMEEKIWHKTKPNEPSRLHGKNIFVSANYEYIFFSDKVQGVSIVNIWAIPLGKYRDQYDTVLMVITPDGEDVWRGPALSDAQKQFVLLKGFNPTFPQMAGLNMSKDIREQTKQASKGRFGF